MTTTTQGLVTPSTASATAVAKTDPGGFPLNPATDPASCRLLTRMVRVMYPHKRFGDGPYERTATAIFKAAAASPAQAVAFASALHDLGTAGFSDLDEAEAYNHLKSLETTAFFKLVRSIAVVTLYDDPEVWELLGYEGSSFEKGGYINRGFDDLDWLPDPRIEEYQGADQ